MTAHRSYQHLEGISLSALEALAGSRLVVTTSGGVLTARAALTNGRLVQSGSDGLLDVIAALTQNRLVTADANGLPTSVGAITAGKLLVSDSNGLPTANTNTMTGGQLLRANASNGHPETIGALTVSRALQVDGSGNLQTSATTATELGFVNGVTSAIQTQLNAKLSTSNGAVGSANLANFAAAYAGSSNIGAALQGLGTSYADYASFGYTPRASNSSVLVFAGGVYLHSSGTTTAAIRRGTTVIGGGTTEPTYAASTFVFLMATDTGHGGTVQTYNFSVKNTTPAGTMSYAVLGVVDAR